MEKLFSKHMILIRGNRLCILELVGNKSRRFLRATELYRGQKFAFMSVHSGE